MGELKALILKGRTVYRFSTGAITVDYVSTLYAESWNYSVESTSFKMKRLSLTPFTLLTCTQTQKVITRLPHFIVQIKHNGPNHFTINLNIDEGTWKLLILNWPFPIFISMLHAFGKMSSFKGSATHLHVSSSSSSTSKSSTSSSITSPGDWKFIFFIYTVMVISWLKYSSG